MATAKKAAKKSRRTVMYSSGGKKLYAVRDASGKFKDIQQYARAHAMDIKRGSKAEVATAVKKVAKTVAAAKKAAPAKKASAVKAMKKAVATAKRAIKKRSAA